MSLILEALKKSEAERNLGRAPGLLSPTPRVAAARHGRWPMLLALLAAVGLGIAATWWWLAPATDAPGEASIATGAATGDPAAAAPAAVDRQAPRALPSPEAVQAASAPAGGAPAPSRDTAPAAAAVGDSRPVAPVAAAPSDPAFRSVERESAALPAGAQLPGAPAAPAAPPPQQQRRAVAATPLSPQPVAASEPATTRAADVAPVATAPPPAAEPPAEALPALRDLTADERAALPPLKLSMHVFAEQPAGRFVLIDGRRYTEGMAVTEGLVLHEIRRDGIVLELRGRRFLLPRPG